ncbi:MULTISPECIES: crotonase/enoyl-CoA hydratase family protein [unclassified Mesorhizobium]|uniref:crotonase/enoyl-CoA hydratase family protein n=1 Tax=unclassified Mesorhizobium TaxID=325217 RepID=UPI00112D1046|nr:MULTISPECIES: crotonase/enoyl-CoA hydratase family protein [unclassified Mesorhizobium]TPL00752.1 crotonase/enoyl-CoA hydratase family protein [Mesorhizobium sp. B2-4-16]TPL76987.1 crotonase/enoyl-CoA hydratase family protein [Mesorhizobium sp. B2-4-3]
MDLIVREKVESGVLLLRLNDPSTRNAISELAMIEALLGAIAEAEGNPAVRVIILTGEGSSFSSGGNIKKLGRGAGYQDNVPAQTRLNYKSGIQRLPLAFEKLEVPVIAAINGPAIGAGLDLALMCDIRIASEAAKFAESFVKLGIIPGDGGAWLLPRIVGFAKASELALTGDTIDAAEGLAIGLVSRVVPPAALLPEAQKIAGRIASNPRHAVRMTKQLLRQAHRLSLNQTLELSSAFQALAHETRDHEEAVAAVREKRKPNFQVDL